MQSIPPNLPPHATHGSVAATVRSLVPGARASEVWRGAAIALLRLSTKECEALALLFEEDRTSDETRLLVLDLLAGAGTHEAQIVMRRLLALAVARRNSRAFAAMVHRLGFITQPDGPTLRFLMSVYAESKNEPHDVRAGCAYALGAAAGHARTLGDEEAATRGTEMLRRDLRAAGGGLEKCALLAALGNAGLACDAQVILRFASDPDPAVRSAAALGLRKLDTPDARSQLIAMIADADPKVAQSALAALVDQQLLDDELECLAELVLSGRTALVLDVRILRIVVSQRARIVDTNGRVLPLENALRLLLGRIEAAASKERSVSGERPAVAPATAAQATDAAGAAGPQAIATKPSVPAAVAGSRAGSRAFPSASTSPTAASALLAGTVPAAAAAAAVASGPPRPVGLRADAPTEPSGMTAKAVLAAEVALLQGDAAPGEVRQSAIPTMPPPPPGPMRLHPSPPPVGPYAQAPAALPYSGGYRLVQKGDTAEQVKARLEALGLDPNAGHSMIPAAPERRAVMESGPVPAIEPAMGVRPIRRAQ